MTDKCKEKTTKIVYCQQWTDGYSLHRIESDLHVFIAREVDEALELARELDEPVMTAVQGEPFLTKISTGVCNKELMTFTGRANCGVRKFGTCPSRI